MPYLAITDQNTLAGVPRFMMACAEEDVSPIIGVEVSVSLGGEEAGHLVLLAHCMAGYRSLCRLITDYRCSSVDRREPLCPLETLLEHSQGLLCLTGAVPFGLLPRLLLSGRRVEAERISSRLLEAFGLESLYVELTDDMTVGSRRRIGRVAAFAQEHSLKTMAAHEVAYLRREDYRLHDVIVAAHNLTSLPGPGYRPTDQLYLQSAKNMSRMFADHPDALRNTAAVAECCAGAVKLDGQIHMPSARLPEGVSAGRKLVELAVKGVRDKYRNSTEDPARVKARLRRELSCIQQLGFAPYFLIAHEAAGIATEKGIPVTGRGSAANSLVCYAIGLTQPEPFANRLLFERFMHEGRKDVPDIDLDFCSLRRDEEIRNPLMERYKEFGTAVAATAVKNSLRGAIRMAAKALGYTPTQIDAFSKHVPTRIKDRDTVVDPIETWQRALKEPAMRNHPLQHIGKYRMLLEISYELNGRLRTAGTHLGGMVLGNHQYQLSELVPLEPTAKEGLLRCQYDKDDIEFAGLPKLDLLGLRMHSALSTAGELASARTGNKVDPYNLPPDDKETYALIRSGNNAGMFQLESPGQLHLSRRLKPRKFQDLVAEISLFRPGPVKGNLVIPYVRRRNGLEPYSVPLPHLLDEVLRPTYGVMVYQEQVLEVCHKVAGFSLAEGDEVRRAMTNLRGPGALGGIRREFIRRAVERGVSAHEAKEIFGWIEGFASYGFSAAHAASFAEISYASAFMKAHYPAEFFAGLLNAQPMGFYSPRVLVNEARREGIEILPPNVNLSDRGFAVEEAGGALRIGLKYTKQLSEKALRSVLDIRGEHPFTSVSDLYARTEVERDGLENLIKAGFVDDLYPSHGARSRALAEIRALPKKRRRKKDLGAIEIPGLYEELSGAAEIAKLSEYDLRKNSYEEGGWELLLHASGPDAADYLPAATAKEEQMEWESLGLNVRRHPLATYRSALRDLGVTGSQEAWSLPHGTNTRVAGLLECMQRPPTRSGRPVYFLMIEDEQGLLQTTIFRPVYERFGHILHSRSSYLLEGRVEQDDRRGFSFLVQRVRDLGSLLREGEISAANAVPASGGFVRAGRRNRRAG
jgi:error-prone DNA polymerase